MEKSEAHCSALIKFFVWVTRLCVGLTFVVSGWAKCIDPWGFIYKIEEYLNVWDLPMPREITLSVAIGLSIGEFIVGLLIASGSMRRTSIWLAAAFMAFMLPLTAYIAIADPVSDCGCFGDFIVLSNVATLVKNVVLAALIVFLLMRNHVVGGLFVPETQWLVVAGAMVYSGSIAFIGYRYQPLIDFRPYPIGTDIFSEETSDYSGEDMYIYEKDGIQQSFTADNLPDSTWTFVKSDFVDDIAGMHRLAVFDGDDDVSEEVFGGEGDMLILAVTDPGIHYLTRARLANELASYVSSRNGRMIALVAAEGDRLEAWRQLALPTCPVYSIEDTSLKELVRGDAALVYLHNGKIRWKRNLASVSHDAIIASRREGKDFFDDKNGEKDVRFHLWLTLGLGVWLFWVYTLNFPNRMLSRYFRRRSLKN